MKSLSFEFHTMPLTLNQVMSKHWRYRYSNFQKIFLEIKHQTAGQIPKTPIKKAELKVTRYSSGSLDRDNSYFTCKPILDSLVELKILEDDTWENVNQPDIVQVKIKRGEPRKIVVELREVKSTILPVITLPITQDYSGILEGLEQ